MTHLSAIILGFVEGATEFIPVSSSGHLILVREFLGVGESGALAFDAILQLATSCALLVYFLPDVWKLTVTAWNMLTRRVVAESDRSLLFAVILGTIPAIVFGLFLEKYMETVFRNAHLVAVTLVLGSLLMWSAQWWRDRKIRAGNVLSEPVTIWKGIVVGLFQCLALVPGISRSGATISGGLFSGLSQEEATRFSFVLSLPILFGAGLKKLFDVRHDLFADSVLGSTQVGGAHFGSSLLLGSIVAFSVGLISIHFLIRYLKTHNLTLFVWYRILLALLIFIVI